MIQLNDKIISPLIFKPKELDGFKEFVENQLDYFNLGIRWYHLPCLLNNKISDVSVYEFNVKPSSIFNDICEALNIFYGELVRLINADEGAIKTRYQKCYKNKYEKDELSYIHYIYNEWSFIENQTFGFFEKKAIGEHSFKNFLLKLKKLNDEPNSKNREHTITWKAFDGFNNPIPFVWNKNEKIILPKSRGKLISIAKQEKESLKKYLRLAAIYQAFEICYLYLSQQPDSTNNPLSATVYSLKKYNCLERAEIERLKLKQSLTAYYEKNITANNSDKQQKQKGLENKVAVQNKIKELAKANSYHGMTTKEAYEAIRRYEAHKIKVSKNDKGEYLKIDAIRNHISQIIKDLP